MSTTAISILNSLSKDGGSKQLYVFIKRKIITERNAQITNLINNRKKSTIQRVIERKNILSSTEVNNMTFRDKI